MNEKNIEQRGHGQYADRQDRAGYFLNDIKSQPAHFVSIIT